MEKKKVLVIVDMQNDFITGPLGNSQCVQAVSEICNVIGSEEFDNVILTKDTHDENYLRSMEGSRLPVAHCLENTKGWEVCDEIMSAVNGRYSEERCKVFCKRTFGSSDLGIYLQKTYGDGKNLQLYFTGVCTGICVINNVSVAKAFCPEAEINVIEKACACVTPDTHKTAIEAMKTFQINII